jgi:hypothetical protein
MLPISGLDITMSNSSLTVNNSTADSYQWLDCSNNYSPFPNALSQVFPFANEGIYAVELTINGCKDTSECFITNPTGLVDDFFGTSFIISPNPAKDKCVVEFKEEQEVVTIHLLSLTGQIISSQKFENSSKLNFELNQPSGIYILELIDIQNRKVYKKILIE